MRPYARGIRRPLTTVDRVIGRSLTDEFFAMDIRAIALNYNNNNNMVTAYKNQGNYQLLYARY